MVNLERSGWGILALTGALLGDIAELRAGTVQDPAGPAGIMIEGPFSFRDLRSPNTAGYGAGDGVTFGVRSVLPNGDADGDGFADSDGVSPPTRGWASQDCVAERTLNFNPMPKIPNQFARFSNFAEAGCRTLGSWRLTFSNQTSTKTVETPPIPEGISVPLVESLWMTATGMAPAFEWMIPSGSTHNETHVRVFDIENLLPGEFARTILREKVAPGTTTFAVPAGLLKPHHGYAFAVELRERRDKRLVARSRAYFNFYTATRDIASAPIVLPIIDPAGGPASEPVARYAFEVRPGSPVYLDAPAAADYVVSTDADGPRFASVLLLGPAAGRLVVSHAGAPASDSVARPGERLDFPAGGVDLFMISMLDAIDASAASSVSNFQIGLTFGEAGSFRGAVSLPSGFATLVGWRYDCGPQLLAGDAAGGPGKDLARLLDPGREMQAACLINNDGKPGAATTGLDGAAN